MKDLDPMSVNLLTVESIYSSKHNYTDAEYARETSAQKLHILDENSVLENDYV